MQVNLRKLVEKGIVKEGRHEINVPIKKSNGEKYSGKTYMIPLEYLYYNNENGRTIISLYHEINQGGGTIEAGHNEDYNKIMENMLSKDNNGKTTTEIDKLKKDILLKGQQEPGYVLLDGRVIDGNRRLTALRLLNQDPKVTKKMYYEAVILDDLSIHNIHDRENIKSLELKIQHGRLGKVDYHPIDKAVDAYKTIVKEELLSEEKYAEDAGLRVNKVRDMIIEAELIEKFLNFINSNSTNYSLAKELELDGPIQEIRTKYKQFKDQENAEELLNAIFAKIVQLRLNGEDFKAEFRSIKKGILGKEKEEEFVEDMEDVSDTIMDILEQEEEIQTFSQVVRAIDGDNEARSAIEEVEKITSTYAQEISNEEIMNEPLKLVSRALNSVRSINEETVTRLNEEDRDTFFSTVREIQIIFNGLNTR